MSRYTLKPSTTSVYFIYYRGGKIGSVMKHNTEDRWLAKDGRHVVYGSTASEAFEELVRVRNRVQICGENNEQKARETLERRNEQMKREVDQFNKLVGFPAMRVRNRRVKI